MSVSGRSTSMSFLRYLGILFSVVVVFVVFIGVLGLYMKFRANLYGFSWDFLRMVYGFSPSPRPVDTALKPV